MYPSSFYCCCKHDNKRSLLFPNHLERNKTQVISMFWLCKQPLCNLGSNYLSHAEIMGYKPTNTRGGETIKKIKCMPVFRFQTPQIGFLTNFPYSFRFSGIVEVASHDDLHYVRHVTARLKGPKNSDWTASSQPSQPLWATLWHSTDIKRAETLKTDSWFCLCCKSEWNSG